jgi:oxygen-independent coproporphyrinogen-3 oxidase
MPATTKSSLSSWLEASPFQGYAYAYPHKTAYRPLRPPRPLKSLWAAEDRKHLFLYVHVPFCEMRCGFCNLFTTAQPEDGLVRRWLGAMERQAQRVQLALGHDAVFVRGAIGGGTPTFLEVAELTALLSGLRTIFGGAMGETPFSVEMSPSTVTAEKLALLREFGMHRASLGVQSFVDAEVRMAGRAQRRTDVDRALELMAASGVPVRNIDLIYGIPGQTRASWRASLQQAVAHAPEEIYLYPLYVRPLTGLDRLHRQPGDDRSALYREGRDWLLDRGYRQISMRLFRSERCRGLAEPIYVCQEDGMVGLGPGARSYTRAIHYSSDYAVARSSVVQIVERFVAEGADDYVRYGAALSISEQQRRYLIKSLLRCDGLDRHAYRERFGTEALLDWPQLSELAEHGMASLDERFVRPTFAGLEWSDAIGPWLYSEPMRRQMAEFAWT